MDCVIGGDLSVGGGLFEIRAIVLLIFRQGSPLFGLKCTLLSTFHLENHASIMNNIFANLFGILNPKVIKLHSGA